MTGPANPYEQGGEHGDPAGPSARMEAVRREMGRLRLALQLSMPLVALGAIALGFTVYGRWGGLALSVLVGGGAYLVLNVIILILYRKLMGIMARNLPSPRTRGTPAPPPR